MLAVELEDTETENFDGSQAIDIFPINKLCFTRFIKIGSQNSRVVSMIRNLFQFYISYIIHLVIMGLECL